MRHTRLVADPETNGSDELNVMLEAQKRRELLVF